MELAAGFVLGILASAIAAVGFEYLMRPKLDVLIDPSGRIRGKTPSSGRPLEFHHLLVRNSPPRWAFLSRRPAWSVKSTIEVFDEQDQPVIGPVSARWTSQPEPLIPSAILTAPVNLLDPARLILGRKVDVHAHEDQQVSLLVKYEGDDYCYVFANDSYRFPDWQNPKWRIPIGSFRVLFSVYFEGGRTQYEFALRNEGPALSDVVLSPGDHVVGA